MSSTLKPDPMREALENALTHMHWAESNGPEQAAYDQGRAALSAPDDRKELVEALGKLESTLSGLAESELTIDYDRNRTPERLAIRDYVYAALGRARAILAKHQA